jgi:hypothetical protein
MIDKLVCNNGCELSNMVTQRLQITAEVGAYFILNGLDDLSRGLIFLDKTLDFVDGKTTESALKLRGDSRVCIGECKNGSECHN